MSLHFCSFNLCSVHFFPPPFYRHVQFTSIPFSFLHFLLTLFFLVSPILTSYSFLFINSVLYFTLNFLPHPLSLSCCVMSS